MQASDNLGNRTSLHRNGHTDLLNASTAYLAPNKEPICQVEPLPVLGGERRTYFGVFQPFVAHSHDHYVFGRVLQGKRELELNGRDLTLEEGDVIVFNPGDVHGCKQASEDPFAYDSISVGAEVLDGLRLGFPSKHDEDVVQAWDTLTMNLDCACAIEEKLMDSLRVFVSLLAEDDAPTETQSLHEKAVLATYAHIQGHLACPLNVAALAESLHMSEYALIRAYRKRFSITPVQHLASLRIERACELLKLGAGPNDVAFQLGFADQAHLTRAFKQRMGVTPAAYRRMALNLDGASRR